MFATSISSLKMNDYLLSIIIIMFVSVIEMKFRSEFFLMFQTISVFLEGNEMDSISFDNFLRIEGR